MPDRPRFQIVRCFRAGLFLAFATLFFVPLFAAAATSEKPTADHRETLRNGKTTGNLKDGDSAPGFALRDAKGRLFTLDDQFAVTIDSQPATAVVIAFFQVHCPPCRRETEKLNRLTAVFQPLGVRFLMINLMEEPQQVERTIESWEIEFPVLYDRFASAARRYGVVDKRFIATVPTLFVIDNQKKIRLIEIGETAESKERIRRTLKALTRLERHDEKSFSQINPPTVR